MTTHTQAPTWTLGDRLRKARDLADISSTDMADRLGVSRNTISNWEHDKTSPPLTAVRVWSAETGVAIAWLVETDEDDDDACGWSWDDQLVFPFAA